ncbi:competence protein ComE [Pseudidiomarina aestuarii]|uniref:Competence protein ComE n=1 Tax=Pseudidiomarina aestuarii TaxID=624146 RepID=A0A2T4D6I3_9GAMM|nr:competence protein ComE [Pseudidiomarina aestuarii]
MNCIKQVFNKEHYMERHNPRRSFLVALAVVIGGASATLYAEPSFASMNPLVQKAAAVATEQVNLNTATAEQLAMNLTGVGLKRAQAIIELREKIGGFSDINQLLQVKGIGPRMLEINKDRLAI